MLVPVAEYCEDVNDFSGSLEMANLQLFDAESLMRKVCHLVKC